MKKEKPSRTWTPMGVVCTGGVVLFVAAVFIAVYMMANNMGQVPGIDFGPGQYYYTDIPGWQKYFLPDHYDNPVPMGVLLVLFFAWGLLMYRLWAFLDRKLK
ncbi:MAG: hypothetical protein HFG59_13260 [Lachnospiraceae bacterium]|nr:hypothetical protein [Lachnospiraceae bacterium]